MGSTLFPGIGALGLHVGSVILEADGERNCPVCRVGVLRIEGYPLPAGCRDNPCSWSVCIECDNCVACASGRGAALDVAAQNAMTKWDDAYPPVFGAGDWRS